MRILSGFLFLILALDCQAENNSGTYSGELELVYNSGISSGDIPASAEHRIILKKIAGEPIYKIKHPELAYRLEQKEPGIFYGRKSLNKPFLTEAEGLLCFLKKIRGRFKILSANQIVYKYLVAGSCENGEGFKFSFKGELHKEAGN